MLRGFHGVVLIAVALHAGGCDEGLCPGGCAADEVCDADAKVCVRPAADCTVVGCEDPRTECDKVTRSCVPIKDCLTDGCPRGQVCSALDHACEQLQGCRVDECRPGLECDLTTGQCRPPGCRRDGDCKAGRVCDGAKAQCVAGCRGEGRCPPGGVCSLILDPELAAEGTAGRCVDGCIDDPDCPFGQACERADGAEVVGVCQEEPRCTLGDQCRTDEVCERGSCVRGPCTEGIPCPERAYCDPETGRCLAADCTDDLFEENDDADGARQLLPQAYAHLRICPADEDWYLVEAEAGSKVRASIRFDPAAGDLDLQAFDSDLYRLASSRGLGNPELVTAAVGPDRTVLLRILGVNGAQAQYFLEIDVTGAIACEDDDREDNDDFRTPAPLPAGAYDDLRLCPGDEDWFSVVVEAGDGLEISLESEASPPPMLERLGPDGRRETAVERLGGRRLRLQQVAEAGRHLLRIRTDDPAPITYSLDLRTHPGGLPCQDDDLEDNDSPDEASALVGRTYTALVACPGDVDWFAVTLERPGGSVSVELRAEGTETPPELTLFGPDGALAPEGEDRLHATIGPTQRVGEVLIRVTPASDAGPLTYDLAVELTAGPDPCADDRLESDEGNDAAARATLLRPGAVEGLVLCPESPEDWYAVDVASGGAVRLRVEGEGVSCGLRTTDGARLIQACEGEDGAPATAAAIGLDRGRYRLRVHGVPPAEGLAYRLELEVLP